MGTAVYVDSAATGAANGTSWTDAYTSLVTALATETVGGKNYWIASGHSESAAGNFTINLRSPKNDPNTFISVDKTGSTPPVQADLLAGATFTVTTSGDLQIQNGNSGYAFLWGLTFTTDTSASNMDLAFQNGNQAEFLVVNCIFNNQGTIANNEAIASQANTHKVTYVDCKFRFGHTGHQFRATAHVIIINGTFCDTGTVPTELIGEQNNSCILIGCDLTNVNTTIKNNQYIPQPFTCLLVNCTLNAAATLYEGPDQANDLDGAIFIMCDDGTQVVRHEKHNTHGSQIIDTAVVRTGGASDGTTPISWKLTTESSTHVVQDFQSFESLPIVAWNASTKTITVTVYGTWGGGAVPNDDDIWFEVDYLDNAADVGSARVSSSARGYNGTYLTAETAVAADTVSVWGADTSPARINFKMQATFTPAVAGPLTIVVKAGLPSTTFYIDPKPEIV